MERHSSKKKTAPQVKRPCHRCHGTGRAQCDICGGSGMVAKGKDGRLYRHKDSSLSHLRRRAIYLNSDDRLTRALHRPVTDEPKFQYLSARPMQERRSRKS